MATIPAPSTPVNLDPTLRALAAQARTRYAGETARLDRGLVLALNGAVTLHADGTASVQSASDAEVVYHVNGHCDCPDASRAPEGRCKHRWAKCFVKRATQQVAEEAAAHTYYARYYTADGAWLQGTAQQTTDRGWVFTADDDSFTLAYAGSDSLVLGGRCDLVAMQREADGDLVRKVCGY